MSEPLGVGGRPRGTAGVTRALILALGCLGLPAAAAAHDWYGGLRNGLGELCCSVRDCEPAAPCTTAEGREGLSLLGRCRAIPWDRVLPMASPDGRAHVCAWRHPTLGERIVCVILPGSA